MVEVHSLILSFIIIDNPLQKCQWKQIPKQPYGQYKQTQKHYMRWNIYRKTIELEGLEEREGLIIITFIISILKTQSRMPQKVNINFSSPTIPSMKRHLNLPLFTIWSHSIIIPNVKHPKKFLKCIGKALDTCEHPS